MSNVTVSCFGPRSSLATPSRKGFSTLDFGGNTSCYHVQAGPFSILLDAGYTGLVVAAREGAVWEL